MKVLGYCKGCGNPMGEEELDLLCRRCGTLTVADNLLVEPPEPVTNQIGMDLYKRPYKRMVKGVRNRSSRKGL